jgi:hypothetical protein
LKWEGSSGFPRESSVRTESSCPASSAQFLDLISYNDEKLYLTAERGRL